MSHSILICENRLESFRDSELFAAVALLEYMSDQQVVDEQVRSLLTSWREHLLHSGPGTIDFDLAPLAADVAVRSAVTNYLEHTASYIGNEWPTSIPDTALNRFEPHVIRFSGYPAPELKATLLRLRHLITPKPGTIEPQHTFGSAED